MIGRVQSQDGVIPHKIMEDLTRAIIELKQVSYTTASGKPIFRDISLSIQPGHIVAIMGPSGTGKTTLLKLIGGQLKPDAGEVILDGVNVPTARSSTLYRLRQKMGFLFQQGALFTDLNVFENIAFPLREHTRLPEDMIRDCVRMILEAVGLRGAERLNTHELSGGMAHRVALARAMVLGPRVMLYDEPFTGQDPIVLGVLLKLIRELNKAFQLTSVIVSHDIAETASIADYLYIISDQKIIAQGPPQTVLTSDAPMVHQFVKGLPDGPVSFRYPAREFAEEFGL